MHGGLCQKPAWHDCDGLDVKGKDEDYVETKASDMELPGRRRRGRPNRRFMDPVKEDMVVMGAAKEDAEDWLR